MGEIASIDARRAGSSSSYAGPGVRRSACRGDRPRPCQAECRRRGDGRRAARRVRALVGFRHFADLACGQVSAYRSPRVFPQRPGRISRLATDAPSGCRGTNNMGHGANRIVQRASATARASRTIRSRRGHRAASEPARSTQTHHSHPAPMGEILKGIRLSRAGPRRLRNERYGLQDEMDCASRRLSSRPARSQTLSMAAMG